MFRAYSSILIIGGVAVVLFAWVLVPISISPKSPGQRLADEVYACERRLKFPEPDEIDYTQVKRERGHELGACLDKMRTSLWYQIFQGR
jgi:hypothetical protein